MGFTDSQRLMFLDALETVGVDNWQGYDEAVALYKQWVKEEQEHFDDEDSLLFELGGFEWRVVERVRLKNYGDCDINTRTIRIRKNLDSQLKEQTFCHELQHAMEIAMGKHTDDHNEEEIDKRAVFLHQFLKTAKYIE